MIDSVSQTWGSVLSFRKEALSFATHPDMSQAQQTSCITTTAMCRHSITKQVTASTFLLLSISWLSSGIEFGLRKQGLKFKSLKFKLTTRQRPKYTFQRDQRRLHDFATACSMTFPATSPTAITKYASWIKLEVMACYKV